MKLDNTKIRSSLDNRLSALEADPARRARIRRRIYEAEEPVMKRKFRVSVALAVAMMLALVGTAVAVGINLFEYFGRSYERFKEIAPQTELRDEATTEIRTEELGVTTISINSAYYDGQSLMVSYTVENDQRIEFSEPTAEQIAEMEKVVMDAIDGWYPGIPEAFEQAVAAGTPCGLADYSVYPHDTFEADGIELSSSMGLETSVENGRFCLIEFTNPLPEEVQNRDSLEIRMGIAMSTVRFWFDGKDLYRSVKQRDLGELTAVANRADAQTQIYAGEGSYNGIPVRLRAEASAVQIKLSISAEGDAFPRFDDSDTWYEVCLEDERGERLIAQGNDVRTDGMDMKYEGTGKLPEQMKAYILVCAEEGETYAELMEATEPIILTPQN